MSDQVGVPVDGHAAKCFPIDCIAIQEGTRRGDDAGCCNGWWLGRDHLRDDRFLHRDSNQAHGAQQRRHSGQADQPRDGCAQGSSVELHPLCNSMGGVSHSLTTAASCAVTVVPKRESHHDHRAAACRRDPRIGTLRQLDRCIRGEVRAEQKIEHILG